MIYLKKIIYIFISLIVLFIFSYAGIKLLNDRGKENISWAVVYIKERQAYFNSNKFNVEEFDIINKYMIPAVLGNLSNEEIKRLLNNHCIEKNNKCAQINLVLAGMFLGKDHKSVDRSITESEKAIKFAENFYLNDLRYDRFPLYLTKDLLTLFKIRNLEYKNEGCGECYNEMSSIKPFYNSVVFSSKKGGELEALWLAIISEMYLANGEFSVPVYVYTYLVDEGYGEF